MKACNDVKAAEHVVPCPWAVSVDVELAGAAASGAPVTCCGRAPIAVGAHRRRAMPKTMPHVTAEMIFNGTGLSTREDHHGLSR